MSQSKRQLHLNAFIMATGHHIAAWRHPQAQADAPHNLQHYIEVAQAAEAAKFDAVFVADVAAISGDSYQALSRTARAAHFEPITLWSAIAAVTRNIGLVSTITTTYNEPYTLARQFASLDHISNGRAAWNLVTSANPYEAYNFGHDSHLQHSKRYERAEEFIDVVKGLWDSWEDDAFIVDRESGRYFDPDKLHVLNHKGKHFNVRGPLNVARPVQGYPVQVQAGASEPGKELAARTAEVVFTAAQTLEEAQAFYADVKSRLARYGRTPDQLHILPGVFAVVGRSEEEAQEKYRQLQDLIHPDVGLSLLQQMIGDVDLSQYPLDGPLPPLSETNNGKSRQSLLIELAQRDKLSIRELYLRIAGARGHWTIVGSAEQIADQLELWFNNGAADGFNVLPPTIPGGLTDFIELVLPELRRRGLFREEYEGKTLRENLGLARPENQHVQVRNQQQAA